MEIGMVEAIWKIITSIINTRIRVHAYLNGALNGFWKGRGTVTTTLEEKMNKNLEGICHEHLFQVLLNVKKVYESLNRLLCMETLRGYGLNVDLQRLIKRYWDGWRVVPRSRRYYGQKIQTGKRVTQRDLVSPTIFNIVVDTVVWETLREVCRPQEALHRMGWAMGEQNIVSYADDGRIAGRKPIQMQGILTTLMRMFEYLGLYINMGNINSTTCAPGFLRAIWERMPTSGGRWVRAPYFESRSGRG